MRKIISFIHVSLDGFIATTNGDFSWVKVDPEMFDLAGRMTEESDTALYGRVTYGIMEEYWPTAGDKPDASKHDLEHSKWYNSVPKLVLSRTLQTGPGSDVRVINENMPVEIQKIKNLYGKNIIVFGSTSAVQSLMQYNLVDEFWILVNPILLGSGMPFFKNITDFKYLKLVSSKVFESGVVALNYALIR
jgi:dihydrofolate reductase